MTMFNTRKDGVERQRKHRTSSAADKVVAATAGKDTWKTYAGRNHGTDQFELLDLFRGLGRSIHHQFLAGPPSTGTVCPVCLCEPSNARDWHVTWCGHSVCKDCLQQYASSQVNDKEYNGLLRCPVCNQELRRKDALAAFGENLELIQTWDTKIRNQLLRALPNYRPCPKCCNQVHDPNSYASKDRFSEAESGGGFVTPECLKPHYDERREAATRILHVRQSIFAVITLVYIFMISIIANNPSKSASVDLFFMMLLIYPCFKMGTLTRYWVAEVARQAFFKPITVECPCCNEAFILPAESNVLNDDESYRWIDKNTRQCPSCSVKIVKSGGCNHMRCSHCRADFCWACMRLRTNCQAYRCVNGAKYGNAVPSMLQVESRSPDANDSILAFIDHLLEGSRPSMQFRDLLFLVACFNARHIGVVRYGVSLFLDALSIVFVSQVLLGTVAVGIVVKACLDIRRRVPQLQRHQQQQRDLFFTIRTRQQRMEEEMLNQAILRSIEDM